MCREMKKTTTLRQDGGKQANGASDLLQCMNLKQPPEEESGRRSVKQGGGGVTLS